jgi:hypothetical protein
LSGDFSAVNWKISPCCAANSLEKSVSGVYNEYNYVGLLIKDDIQNCACYFTGSKVEIEPYCPNIGMFSAFSTANTRILMSATTQEDSFFIKTLGISGDAVKHPLMNHQKAWSGEKMMIISR